MSQLEAIHAYAKEYGESYDAHQDRGSMYNAAQDAFNNITSGSRVSTEPGGLQTTHYGCIDLGEFTHIEDDTVLSESGKLLVRRLVALPYEYRVQETGVHALGITVARVCNIQREKIYTLTETLLDVTVPAADDYGWETSQWGRSNNTLRNALQFTELAKELSQVKNEVALSAASDTTNTGGQRV